MVNIVLLEHLLYVQQDGTPSKYLSIGQCLNERYQVRCVGRRGARKWRSRFEFEFSMSNGHFVINLSKKYLCTDTLKLRS